MSFVSVTQQFNTTTSMGRLTLNMLLSFAQFEREVTGERIRDKIAVSKRRGMWMGGLPPLGYDVKERKLVMNEPEANTVRHIYRRYAELRSVRALKTELDSNGIFSKARLDRFGRRFGGKPLVRGALYLILKNRIYRGEIVHKQNSYPGEHAPIIDEALWDEVQQELEANRVNRLVGADIEAPSLLAGRLFDSAGERMTPTHTNKNGKRYRYYASRGLIKDRRGASPLVRRVPAGELEALVENRFISFLNAGTEVLAAIESDVAQATESPALIGRAAELALSWPKIPPAERRRILLTLLAHVGIHGESIEIHVLVQGLLSILQGECVTLNRTRVVEEAQRTLTWSIPVRLRRTGIEKRLVMDSPEGTQRRSPDHSLARLIAQAHQYHAMLMRGEGKTIVQLANDARVTGSYFTRVMRLSFLAPEILTAILRNRHPLELSAKRLANETRLPIAWDEQRALLRIG